MMTRLLVGILTPAIRAKLILHMAAPERGAERPAASGGGRPLRGIPNANDPGRTKRRRDPEPFGMAAFYSFGARASTTRVKRAPNECLLSIGGGGGEDFKPSPA